MARLFKSGNCRVDGCGWSPRVHFGLCNAHYIRLKRRGSVMETVPLAASKNRRRKIEIVGDEAHVHLTQGKIAVIDAAGISLIDMHNWYAVRDHHTFYAVCHVKDEDGVSRRLLMHQVLGPKGAQIVDHADGDGLNNRRSNLRAASFAQNQWNKRKAKNNTSGFKGVRYADWAGGEKKWRAQIMKDHKYISLGYHLTPEDAAKAYDEAAMRLFSDFARPNDGPEVCHR